MSAFGSMSIVLHAHLPYVRHPDYAHFLEEDWLYEAITETYVPLLAMLDRLAAEGVPVKLTMSMTPPLCEMLTDDLLKWRYAERLDALLALAERERDRRWASDFRAAAEFYVHELVGVRDVWRHYSGDLVRGFRRHQDEGRLCILTCPATHGYLPLMATDAGRRAQIRTAVDNYAMHFGRAPDGIWLSECAYAPGIDRILADHGLRFFMAETHGITYGTPRPRFGHYRPIFTPSGVAAFGRDPECSKEVWSAKEGYPGDSLYREFYRDAGWEAPADELAELIGDGPRRNVGLKYHRITGEVALGDKEPYVPLWAKERAEQHAWDFVAKRRRQVATLASDHGFHPHLVAPYDAELFGHWWFEGPTWLEAVLRKSAREQDDVRLTTPRDWLGDVPVAQVVEPAASSWGDGGFYKVWMNGGNAWMYEHLHRAEERMVELAHRFDHPSHLERRALNQAARELLLAQSSDWAFIVTMDTTVPYAEKRTRDHLHHFNRLYDRLTGGGLDEDTVRWLEERHNIFAAVDYTAWRGEGPGEHPPMVSTATPG